MNAWVTLHTERHAENSGCCARRKSNKQGSDSAQANRDRYYEIRVWFFLGNIALSISTLIGVLLVGVGEVDTTVPIAGLGLLLLLSIVGLITAKPRIHAIIITLAISAQMLGIAGFIFRFGP